MPFVFVLMGAHVPVCIFMHVRGMCTFTHDCLPKSCITEFVLKGVKTIYMKLISMKRHIQRIRVYGVR